MDAPSAVTVEVAPFKLDRFEVSVGRFLSFLAVFDSDSVRTPEEGAGGIEGLPGTGWQSEWSEDPTLTSPTAASLRVGLQSCGVMLDAEHRDLPMVCVNWYLAQAFCIWDGGRLPTEAEWTFAAMGGDEQRPYPWSEPSFDASINEMRACYDNVGGTCSSPAPVGSYPRGKGKWETRDLAGNAMEWAADMWRPDPAQPPCTERDLGSSACENAPGPARRVIKGGSYAHMSQFALNAYRAFGLAAPKREYMGFRCALNLD